MWHACTQIADDGAISDSDLSDPGEYEKYGPSDEEVLDGIGSPIPKGDPYSLPRGVDTSGK